MQWAGAPSPPYGARYMCLASIPGISAALSTFTTALNFLKLFGRL